MKILSAAAIAMLLLAGCSTTPDPTPSHPTWCNKDPKKEPHFHDCNGNLYLPGHEPEECIPEEPPEPVVRKPVEPPKPDPIVGTYRIFYTRMETSDIYRIYQDGTFLRAKLGFNRQLRWEKGRDAYRILDGDKEYLYSVRTQSARGEPELVPFGTDWIGGMYEGIKLSSDPDYLTDLYVVGCERKMPGTPCFKVYEPAHLTGARHDKKRGVEPGWHCINIGQLLSTDLNGMERLPVNKKTPRDYGNTESACLAVCEKAMRFTFGEVGEGNCSDYKP